MQSLHHHLLTSRSRACQACGSHLQSHATERGDCLLCTHFMSLRNHLLHRFPLPYFPSRRGRHSPRSHRTHRTVFIMSKRHLRHRGAARLPPVAFILRARQAAHIIILLHFFLHRHLSHSPPRIHSTANAPKRALNRYVASHFVDKRRLGGVCGEI